METNQQKEIPLFVFVLGTIASVTLLGGILMLSDSKSSNVSARKQLQQPHFVDDGTKRTTYKMVGSPVIVLTSLSPEEANCLKGGGGLSCFTK